MTEPTTDELAAAVEPVTEESRHLAMRLGLPHKVAVWFPEERSIDWPWPNWCPGSRPYDQELDGW